MKLAKHSRVHVKTLDRDGVVVGSSKPGMYEVAIGSLVVHCLEKDLGAPEETRAGTPPRTKKAKPKKPAGPSRSAFIDLHGMTVADALEAVERKIDEALAADRDRLDVMHGIGSGKLRSALHRYFATLSVVKRFKLSDDNPGVTWVFF